MKNKTHELKTIKQVVMAVNEKNLKGFLLDFERWLKIAVGLRDNRFVRIELETFKWHDDGNWGQIKEIILKVKKKK